jgi:hypothetical protein
MIYSYFLNGFIGHSPPHNKYFYFPDEVIKNQKYKNIEITYEYNSNGHRCKEINDLGKDYILTTGCSATEGHAMKLEETYSYMLAKKLGCNYYNLGLKGSSTGTTYYNLTMFLSKVKVKPKFIVIQWPHFNRYHLVHKDGQYAVYNPYADFNYNYDYQVFKTLHKFEVPEAMSSFYRKMTLEFIKPFNIPVLELNFMKEIELSPEKYNTKVVTWPGIEKFLDFGRDNVHAGVETNQLWTNKLLEAWGYKQKNFDHL